MVVKRLNAEPLKFKEAVDFIDEQLEKADCPMKTKVQIKVAAEEIFVNVAHYAYHQEVGEVEIRVEITENPKSAVITFSDSGKPFNPLEKPDPDITLSAEERDIGGLGIFMVKNTMDDVRYEFVDGQNCLTITKSLE